MSLIALGVTGCIGAYKAVEVARGLQQRGHDVVAIMTRGAQQFVGPLTFEAITRRRVIVDQFEPGANADIAHVALASDIDLLLVVPATANVIGKLANGIADDFLSSMYLATRARVLVAPAMNTNMLEHAAVQENLGRLTQRGVRMVEPGEGFLACGWIGKGRLAEPEVIVAAADGWLHEKSSLTGYRVLVTAGPTYEDLDPVRYIGNRSSGRMGYALAEVAARRGAHTLLVSGPTNLPVPAGVELVRARSANSMRDAVMARVSDVDAVIMAAAVADYTPAGGAETQKIVKGGDMTIALTRTPDILAELGRWRGDRRRPMLVGFAAETQQVVERARRKLTGKRVDAIVANDVSGTETGFEVDRNAATLVTETGEEVLPPQSKIQMAGTLMDRIEAWLTTSATPEPAP